MADQWDEINKHNLIKAELMVGLLDIKHGDKVLDVGTGTGVLLPILSLFTNENDITAIDGRKK
jgi:demethylmenaquinone methyltransferase/2-methoxy-6-polyprenyl-1,4-benzoquinol methylase